jgi:hypothetical protein
MKVSVFELTSGIADAARGDSTVVGSAAFPTPLYDFKAIGLPVSVHLFCLEFGRISRTLDPVP